MQDNRRIETICDTVKTLQSDRSSIDTTLQDIKRFILPNQQNVQSRATPGDTSDDRTQRYDDTAPDAVMRAAGALQGALTPSTSQWNRLVFSDEALNDDKDARDWLDECGQRQHKAYNDSNFGNKINVALQQIIAGGTTCMLYEEKPKRPDGAFSGINFDVPSWQDYLFTEGPEGRSDAIYRHLRLTARQAKAMFENRPRFNGLGETITRAVDDAHKANVRFSVIHAIRPRSLYSNKGDALDMPIESCYVALNDKHLICEGGYHELPGSVWRWDINPEDNGWGRGPGWIALPTVKTLNITEKLVLKGLAKDISPPLIVPNKSVVGGIRTTPNGIIYFDGRKAGTHEPKYLNSGTRWDVNQLERENKRKVIQRIFFNHLLELPTDGTPMTLGEAERRYQLQTRDMVGVYERLIYEGLSPNVLWSFAVMFRANAFPPAPPAVVDMIRKTGGLSVDVQYTGPLARSLQREKVASIEQTYGVAAMISQAKGGDPSAFDVLDDDAAMKVIHEQSGAPSAILRSPEQVQQIRQERAQRQAQQVEAQNLKTLAGAGKDAATAAAAG